MVKDYPCSHRDIEAGCLFGILRDVNEIVAYFFVDGNEAGPFIAQKECGISVEGVVLNGHAALSDFHSTNFDSLFIEGFFALLKWVVGLKLDLFVGALIAEHVELFEYFDFFWFRSACNEEDLFEPESAGTSDDVADVVAFADVMEQKVAPRFVCLHQQSYNTIDLCKIVRATYNNWWAVAAIANTANTVVTSSLKVWR
jgi:hypothetical protein